MSTPSTKVSPIAETLCLTRIFTLTFLQMHEERRGRLCITPRYALSES